LIENSLNPVEHDVGCDARAFNVNFLDGRHFLFLVHQA
jgi:hypothetical protein